MILTSPKLTQEQADDLMSPMELDLKAFYNILLDEILETLDKNKDMSVDDIIHEIGRIIA